MPYAIRKSGNGYAIVNKNTGKVVGHSKTKKDAKAAVRARNAAAHSK